MLTATPGEFSSIRETEYYTHTIQKQSHNIHKILDSQRIATAMREEGSVEDSVFKGVQNAYTTGYAVLLGSDRRDLANILERGVEARPHPVL